MPTTKPELQELADTINREVEAGSTSEKLAIEHYRNAGKALLNAKKTVKHGEWEDWLKENCKLSIRQSQRYMRIAKNDVPTSQLEASWREVSGNQTKASAARKTGKPKPKPKRPADEPVTIPVTKKLRPEWDRLLRKAGEILGTGTPAETILHALQRVVDEGVVNEA